ncbi:MAG: chemotaxis protein, partial [Pseudomonadota bacterium]
MFSRLFGSGSHSASQPGQTRIATEDLRDLRGQVAAIDKSQGVIEFSLDGLVLTANANFLNLLGYTLDEIRGKHHRMFLDPAETETAAYRQFWEKLGSGQFDSGRYRRFTRDRHEVWIQASYNPVLDENG